MIDNELDPIRIFIGYDKMESIAYHTLCQSIIEHTTVPVSITPLSKNQLSIYKRERSKLESTDFSLTRFLVPWLSNYNGWSIFCDCDFVFTEDLFHLWNLKNEDYAVMVCKHQYVPKKTTKFLNSVQQSYDKKNWSSLVLFNNRRCQALTPEIVNTSSGLFLHQFEWLESEKLIGEVPREWNYLCGEENQVKGNPNGIHFTNGGPWFSQYQNSEFSEVWNDYREKAFSREENLHKVEVRHANQIKNKENPIDLDFH